MPFSLRQRADVSSLYKTNAEEWGGGMQGRSQSLPPLSPSVITT
ncbi:hypothetical protein PN441_10335 [Spirulina major CS-329]|nr:hypothetical protein [Spirulina subsalsa CS-330]MDB9503467.1 hypothetical protein [Spirulina major CS-329]